ncbi:MAG TPA: 3-deoxy-manno-octulosonate cytidylyltransferase [Pyrinomonadaceae bacterium]|nr:3-deoxy-manno-octulosonate cytidylyltransferase [Pyrinomonadaceae bacterium]
MGLTEQKSNIQVIAVIPARYHSTRLEGKLLLPLAGKPLILHTAERVRSARNIDRVIVATDDPRIKEAVENAGCGSYGCVMTSPDHQSGSDRIAEAAETFSAGTIVVNVQGDEPMINTATIERAVEAMLAAEAGGADIVTSCEPINDIKDVLSPDVVKVVIDTEGFALYFSRAAIPFPREAVKKHGDLASALQNEPEMLAAFRKHTGLYVYRREYLLKYTKLEQTPGEKLEMLEQLRALENGARIKVIEAAQASIGVDTEEDYQRVRKILENL